MGNPTRARLRWLISLISLVVISVLLSACGGPAATPTTSLPTFTATPDTPTAVPTTPVSTHVMDLHPVVWPTVNPTHTHEPSFDPSVVLTVLASANKTPDPICPVCMGHMYLSKTSSNSDFKPGQIDAYVVLHDHPPAEGPVLTDTMIAIVYGPVSELPDPFTPGHLQPQQEVDVYVDPTLDFQFNPTVLPGTTPCAITDPDVYRKLERVIKEVVPQLGRTSGTGIPFTVTKEQVTCIIVAEDRNDNNRLVIGVQGVGVVGGTPQPTVHLAPPTPTP